MPIVNVFVLGLRVITLGLVFSGAGITSGQDDPIEGGRSVEFYVDPDFVGQGRDGSAGNPWNSIRGGRTWQTINAVVDEGAALVGFSDDALGTKRPQGAAWDIGAHEYARSADKSRRDDSEGNILHQAR